MKKKPASEPLETAKPNSTKARSVKKTDKPVSVQASTSTPTGRAKSVARKPLLNAAVEKAKKIFTAKPAVPQKLVESEVEIEAPTVVRRTYARRKKVEVVESAEPLDIPPILLEGDAPSAPAVSGPGEKYSLGATPPSQSFSGGELPESYGTKKLFLTARDPHWLYAHWDLTPEQQRELNAESTDGHLILRIYAHKIEGHPLYEIHVHPDSRHWFAHVERAGNSYTSELGYYSALGKWMRVAVSSCTVTPPDAAAKEDAAEFATIPFEFPFARLMQIIEDAVRDNIPLAQAIEELRRAGHPDLPRFSQAARTTAPGPVRHWTPEQETALAKIISIDESRRVWMGSLEITELIRRRLAHEVASPVHGFGASEFAGQAGPSGISSVTSPFGGLPGREKAKGFWFNVNAELVIYGATEPDAKVTLGGHEIKLRSDGTFSFRFALPDGNYDLPAVAVSADGTDGRAAELRFSRTTEYLGDVGATPPDPALRPPTPDNL
jgi:hypothetical protein